MTAVTVRQLGSSDRPAWLAMRTALYTEADPSTDAEDLDREIDMMLGDTGWAAFAAEADGGELVGLIELFERNYAEGCSTSPIPYIEGLWVAEDWRRRGVAAQLVDAGKAWGRSRGRAEMASDVQLANLGSQAAHRQLGFEETERLVTYRLSLE